MGCPLRWCRKEAGARGSSFVVLHLSLFIHARFVTCFSTGRNNVKRGPLSQDVVM